MNIKKAKEEIKNTVRAYLRKDEKGKYLIPEIRQRPILLIGAPGIGKTQIMEQIARECKIGLVAYTITHHTRQSAVGLPFISKKNYQGQEYSVTEYTMSEIIASVYEKIENAGQKEGILFIDEINCVSETLAPTMLQFLQCKTFGNQKLPSGWIVVAAGNPPEYNKSVRDFDMVTLDRLRKIVVDPDYSVWKEYARGQEVSPALLSYLELRPQNFYRIERDVDGMHFVTARGWEDLSGLLQSYEMLDISVDFEVIQEYLQHEDVARDVSAYLDLYKKYQDDYGIEEVLRGEESTERYRRLAQSGFDERLSVVYLLLSALHREFVRITTLRQVADDWYGFLLECRDNQVEKNGDYVSRVEQLRQQYHQEVKQNYLTKEEQQQKELFFDKLTQAGDAFIFEKEKERFGILRDELEALEDAQLIRLNHAFTFMENAFQNGQEMVVFVTELSMDSHSVWYLQDNSCAAYEKYSQELLVGTKRREILSALAQGEIRGEEHIRDF